MSSFLPRLPMVTRSPTSLSSSSLSEKLIIPEDVEAELFVLLEVVVKFNVFMKSLIKELTDALGITSGKLSCKYVLRSRLPEEMFSLVMNKISFFHLEILLERTPMFLVET